MVDILIIGAGPAGISAAIYAKRAGQNVKVLYYGEASVEKTEMIENYYGFAEGIGGKALYEAGIKQAVNLGIDVANEEVFNVAKEDDIFKVQTGRNTYEAKSVIIATGDKKLRPNIEGISTFEGKGVSYCAVCDGFFFRGKNVVVIGNGNYAMKEAVDLSCVAGSVKILTNGEQETFVSPHEKFEIISKKIKSIKGDSRVSGVEFEDGEIMAVDGIFVAVGNAGSTDFARKLGIQLDGNSIIVDEDMATNIKGLYACGNAVGGLLQINKSAYEGAKAGISASKYIKGV